MTPPSVRVFEDSAEASHWVAASVLEWIDSKPRPGGPVLGLATGSTPLGVYREWCRLHQQQGRDWSRARCFNLDEYWPLDPGHRKSFRTFMREQLFAPAGFDLARCAIPSGGVATESVDRHCAEYEDAIQAAGGLDAQLLGLGPNGHIGFNEPGSDPASRTRKVALAAATRERAAEAFAPEQVPLQGLTMGIGTILSARRIWILAFGAEKAAAVDTALRGPIEAECPASFLRTHSQVEWVLDRAAATTVRG